MALSPEQLAALQRALTGPGSYWQDPSTGLYYGGNYQNTDQNGNVNMGGENNAGYGNALTGYTAANYMGGNSGAGWSPDARAQSLDLSGNATTDWFSPKDPNKMGLDEKLILGSILAMAGGAAYGAMSGAGAAGGGAGGAGGGMGNGAFLGEGAWTPTAGGALDFGGGTAAMGAGGSGVGGAYTTAAADSQLANAAINAGGGDALSGYAAAGAGGVTASPVASGGSWLSNLLPSGASSWLGPAASLLGGLAGAQGQDNSSTTARDIPEWLKPSVNHLLQLTNGQLDRQTAPGYMQGYEDMRTVGQGLLNRPIAGNGFDRFFPGR